MQASDLGSQWIDMFELITQPQARLKFCTYSSIHLFEISQPIRPEALPLRLVFLQLTRERLEPGYLVTKSSFIYILDVRVETRLLANQSSHFQHIIL